jgi:hypothetical protein
MGTKLLTLPVLSALAQAHWVDGDTGLKQTTEQPWAGLTLTAEEVAAIVPVPRREWTTAPRAVEAPGMGPAQSNSNPLQPGSALV